jgi:hypothetical protein
MNIFTKHTQQQGVTYIEHWLFAMGIAWRLLNSVIAFALHAMFPFIDIDKKFDLEATARFILKKNAWIEGMKQNRHKRTFDSPLWQARNF